MPQLEQPVGRPAHRERSRQCHGQACRGRGAWIETLLQLPCQEPAGHEDDRHRRGPERVIEVQHPDAPAQ